ncbi:MAG: AAA family ATPase [Massilia sp.]|uniref:hypothetical protein n=1 Tax=Massilia sp. TaxID=1882437 RepID=UPI002FCB3A8A
MIEILGAHGTSEYRAAEKFKTVFEDLFGHDLVRRSCIKIVVSAKTYGEKRQDIDLVIVGKLANTISLPKSDQIIADARLLSFFFTVEVKDHPPEKLKFQGPKVFVKYKERIEDASEQAEQQKYSAKSYIVKHKLLPPYIISLVLLNNCPSSFIPDCRSNILAMDFDAESLANIIYVANEHRIRSGRALITAFSQNGGDNYVEVAELFAKELEETKLDRKKIDLITARSFDQKYATDDLGTQLLVFSGPGGTGKTINLLQLAYFVYQKRDAKVLVLTYNLALISDIRRMLAIMGMTDDIATPKVKITSVHSFLYWTMVEAGVMQRGYSKFLPDYEKLKSKLLLNISKPNEAIEPWDYVFVDEGQDWPIDEREILYRLYGEKNIVVADGRSQLVRTSDHCDWTKDQKIPTRWVNLSKSLRLKHELCIFTSAIIEQLSISDWRTDPNITVHGGRVIVYIGDMKADRTFLDGVIGSAIDDGNAQVDLCICVPPSMVERSPATGNDEDVSKIGKKRCSISRSLAEWNYEVWDGVDDDMRNSYPTSVKQLRVVQYDSCRGLEGWAVINFAMDELYDYKKQSYEASESELKDLFYDKGQAAEKYARRWLAIPLTRAIDTLVVNIKDPTHFLAETFRRAAALSSSVEVIEK